MHKRKRTPILLSRGYALRSVLIATLLLFLVHCDQSSGNIDPEQQQEVLPDLKPLPEGKQLDFFSLRGDTLYIGVRNPFRVRASGFTPEELQSTIFNFDSSGVAEVPDTTGFLIPQKAGKFPVSIEIGEYLAGEFLYTAIPLPDPELEFGGFRAGGSISASEFKRGYGVGVTEEGKPVPENSLCRVQGFVFVRQSGSGSIETATVRGGRLDLAATKLKVLAQRGDQYRVEEIKVRCPGDRLAREVEPLVYRIR